MLLNQIPGDLQIGSVTAPSHACKHALSRCPAVAARSDERGQWTQHTTRADATMLSRTAQRLRSSLCTETPSHGSQAPLEPSLRTMRSAPRSIWAEHCGIWADNELIPKAEDVTEQVRLNVHRPAPNISATRHLCKLSVIAACNAG